MDIWIPNLKFLNSVSQNEFSEDDIVVTARKHGNGILNGKDVWKSQFSVRDQFCFKNSHSFYPQMRCQLSLYEFYHCLNLYVIMIVEYHVIYTQFIFLS